MTLKWCADCQQSRPVGEFWRNRVRRAAIAARATKACAKCKQVLPRSAFYGMRKAPDGLQHTCKTCQRQRDQARKAPKAPTEHNVRRKSRICSLCSGLRHRVAGRSCAECRLLGGEETFQAVDFLRQQEARSL